MKKYLALLLLIFTFSIAFGQENTTPSEDTETAEKQNEQQSENDSKEDKKSIKNTVFKGEQQLCFHLGFTIPTFTYFPDFEDNKPKLFTGPEMYDIPAGGNLGLSYKYAITDNFLLGGNIEGGLFSTNSGSIETIAAISGALSYTIRRWPVDCIFSFNAGVYLHSINIKDSNSNPTTANFFFKPEFSFYYNINDDWAVGFNTDFWLMPEFYAGNRSEDTALSNYWSFSLAARYRLKR